MIGNCINGNTDGEHPCLVVVKVGAGFRPGVEQGFDLVVEFDCTRGGEGGRLAQADGSLMVDHVDGNGAGDGAIVFALGIVWIIFAAAFLDRILELGAEKCTAAVAFGINEQPGIARIVPALGIAAGASGGFGLVLGIHLGGEADAWRRYGAGFGGSVGLLEQSCGGGDLLSPQGKRLGVDVLQCIGGHLVEVVAEGVQLELNPRREASDRHRPLGLAHTDLEVGQGGGIGGSGKQEWIVAGGIAEQLHGDGVALGIAQLAQPEAGAIAKAGQLRRRCCGVGGGEVGLGGRADGQSDATQEGGCHEAPIGKGIRKHHAVPAVAAAHGIAPLGGGQGRHGDGAGIVGVGVVREHLAVEGPQTGQVQGVVDRVDGAVGGGIEREVGHAHVDRDGCQRYGCDAAALIGPGTTGDAEQFQLLGVIVGAGDEGVGARAGQPVAGRIGGGGRKQCSKRVGAGDHQIGTTGIDPVGAVDAGLGRRLHVEDLARREGGR